MSSNKRRGPVAAPRSGRAAICSAAGSLGLLLVAVATMIPLFHGAFPRSPLYKFIYSAGALVCLLASLFNKAPEGMPLRERRWMRIESWSSIFFCTGAFFLWYPGATPRDWLAFTLAGAIIRIIVFARTLFGKKQGGPRS
ncbi:MAG: hypothetical protein K2M97_03705 [Muribaculaceae bacterium]|nr:hypothetical protein [Muribaculaceae bacterium]